MSLYTQSTAQLLTVKDNYQEKMQRNLAADDGQWSPLRDIKRPQTTMPANFEGI